MDLPAKAIKEGEFERVDLTLLSIDEQKLPIYLQMRRMPLCEKKPRPGEHVIVAVPEETARSHIMSPLSLPFSVPKKILHVDQRCWRPLKIQDPACSMLGTNVCSAS